MQLFFVFPIILKTVLLEDERKQIEQAKIRCCNKHPVYYLFSIRQGQKGIQFHHQNEVVEYNDHFSGGRTCFVLYPPPFGGFITRWQIIALNLKQN